MIEILHVVRSTVVVSIHVKSSLYLFHIPFNLRCLNSLITALVYVNNVRKRDTTYQRNRQRRGCAFKRAFPKRSNSYL